MTLLQSSLGGTSSRQDELPSILSGRYNFPKKFRPSIATLASIPELFSVQEEGLPSTNVFTGHNGRVWGGIYLLPRPPTPGPLWIKPILPLAAKAALRESPPDKNDLPDDLLSDNLMTCEEVVPLPPMLTATLV